MIKSTYLFTNKVLAGGIRCYADDSFGNLTEISHSNGFSCLIWWQNSDDYFMTNCIEFYPTDEISTNLFN